jgi:hypothetical protein
VLTIAESRLKVQRWFGTSSVGPVPIHDSWVRKNTDVGPDPVGGILATGGDIGCAGYGANHEGAVRNVYKITIAGLQEYTPTAAIVGVPLHDKQGPTLVMNAATVAAATIIGVRGAGANSHETSWFTPITHQTATLELVYERAGANGAQGRGWVTPL